MAIIAIFLSRISLKNSLRARAITIMQNFAWVCKSRLHLIIIIVIIIIKINLFVWSIWSDKSWLDENSWRSDDDAIPSKNGWEIWIITDVLIYRIDDPATLSVRRQIWFIQPRLFSLHRPIAKGTNLTFWWVPYSTVGSFSTSCSNFGFLEGFLTRKKN